MSEMLRTSGEIAYEKWQREKAAQAPSPDEIFLKQSEEAANRQKEVDDYLEDFSSFSESPAVSPFDPGETLDPTLDVMPDPPIESDPVDELNILPEALKADFVETDIDQIKADLDNTQEPADQEIEKGNELSPEMAEAIQLTIDSSRSVEFGGKVYHPGDVVLAGSDAERGPSTEESAETDSEEEGYVEVAHGEDDPKEEKVKQPSILNRVFSWLKSKHKHLFAPTKYDELLDEPDEEETEERIEIDHSSADSLRADIWQEYASLLKSESQDHGVLIDKLAEAMVYRDGHDIDDGLSHAIKSGLDALTDDERRLCQIAYHRQAIASLEAA